MEVQRFPMCPLTLCVQFSHYLNPSLESGLFTVDDPILKSHCHSKARACIWLHSWCCSFSDFRQRFKNPLSILDNSLSLALSTFSLCLWLFFLFSYQCWPQNRHFNFLEFKLIHPSFFMYPVIFQKSSQTKTGGRSLSLTTKSLDSKFKARLGTRWIQGQSGAI